MFYSYNSNIFDILNVVVDYLGKELDPQLHYTCNNIQGAAVLASWENGCKKLENILTHNVTSDY